MNRKYGIHPKDYAIGETEKYYSDMAAKGWELVKRGITFSRFQKAEPQKMRYRVEVVNLKSLEDGHLPEEQVAVYEDCGWEYVISRGFLHIFRAPEGSDAPEFYLEPEQQAATLKGLRKQYCSSLMAPFIILAFHAFMAALVGGLFNGRWAAQLYRGLVEETAWVAGFCLFLLWAVFSDLWGFIYISRLYRRMKKGIPLDHAPRSRKLIVIPRIISLLLLLCILGCVGYDYLHDERYAMPDVSDGPYILLSDLGIEGERTTNFVNGEGSMVKANQSLLAEHWDTQEYVDATNGGHSSEEWLYQDVYILKNEDMVNRFVEVLMIDSTFAQSTEDYTLVEIPGLDQAWITERLECIAVKGTTISIFTHPFDSPEEMRTALEVVAKKWDK